MAKTPNEITLKVHVEGIESTTPIVLRPGDLSQSGSLAIYEALNDTGLVSAVKVVIVDYATYDYDDNGQFRIVDDVPTETWKTAP